mmetsp:Transcript_43388/g.117603  ORF Transcript_43388/g.117603 Transcript_43388/m.117603 type:complete len:125 (-) Transcript_43388:517-891(-)
MRCYSPCGARWAAHGPNKNRPPRRQSGPICSPASGDRGDRRRRAEKENMAIKNMAIKMPLPRRLSKGAQTTASAAALPAPAEQRLCLTYPPAVVHLPTKGDCEAASAALSQCVPARAHPRQDRR